MALGPSYKLPKGEGSKETDSDVYSKLTKVKKYMTELFHSH